MKTSDSPVRTLGPYRLEGLVGRGGMGEVWKAYDKRLERWVAAKQIRSEAVGKDSSGKDGARARFRREARTIARLSHPAIVQIFDFLERPDGDWIVMELLTGPTLAETLRQGRLPLDRILQWGREIAEGLAEAHEKGVVHRDLKTENVKVTASGHVRILDFGLAKDVGREDTRASRETAISHSGEVLGTGRAMSPEQARGLAIDHRSDLFSLGTLLYEMATGTSPFRAESLAETLKLIVHHQPESPCRLEPRLPAAFCDLISRLHEKSPDLRPSSARTVAARLAELAILHAAPVLIPEDAEGDETRLESPPDSWPEIPATTEKPARKRKRSWGFAAGVLLVALTIAWLGPRADWRLPFVAGTAKIENGPELSDLNPLELYRQGQELLVRYDQAGNIEKAIETFEQILLQEPRSSAAHAGIARAYWWRYRDSNRDPVFLRYALSAAERSVELDAHLADARVSCGLAYLAAGRTPEALTELEAALVLEPTHADAYFGLAEIHDAQGRFEEAETAYLKAIELRPGDRRFHDDLGALYYKTGRYEESEEAFRKSIELLPDGLHGHRNLAAVLYMQGRYEEAAAAVQEALKIQPRPTLYSTLGTILFSQGLYPDSVAAFEKALELGVANNYFFWANLADAYRWTPGRQEAARESYRRAIQLIGAEVDRQPVNRTLRSRMALYLAKRGEVREALAQVELLGPQARLDATSLFRLAQIYEMAQDRQHALDALGRALEAGFSRAEVRQDPELLDLRTDPRFHRLMMAAEAGD